ncbi:MAG: hypothetical protein V4489_00260 [Chlamydiota bacterium]
MDCHGNCALRSLKRSQEFEQSNRAVPHSTEITNQDIHAPQIFDPYSRVFLKGQEKVIFVAKNLFNQRAPADVSLYKEFISKCPPPGKGWMQEPQTEIAAYKGSTYEEFILDNPPPGRRVES